MSFSKCPHSDEVYSSLGPKKNRPNWEPLKESRLTNVLQSIDDHTIPSSATPSPLTSPVGKKGNVMEGQHLSDQDPDLTLLDIKLETTSGIDSRSLGENLHDLRYKPIRHKAWLRRAHLTSSFHPQSLSREEQLARKVKELQNVHSDLIQNHAETRIRLDKALLEREAALKERDLALARVTFLTSQLNAVHALSAVDISD
ncbi:hypothetical protein D9758_010814 [Tetrapyrgos nigripes]|uniref:Uncharacterized protein n=1 Tax=Tetrapyrgos nigripes TaxID=182062 RepID=A0A8H5LQ19_9AGAR|nr:hypothetical protein D9758_010814 [Tetrapyrgos nigripes]